MACERAGLGGKRGEISRRDERRREGEMSDGGGDMGGGSVRKWSLLY